MARTTRKFRPLRDGGRSRRAGSKAFDLLLALYGSCKRMSAKDFCILCHHMTECGMVGGQWSTFALPPGKQSGKYKAKVDRNLPCAGPFYMASIASTVRNRAHVHQRQVTFRQVFRTIADEVRKSDDIRDILENGPMDDDDSV